MAVECFQKTASSYRKSYSNYPNSKSHLKGADPKPQQAWMQQFPSPSMHSSLLNQPSAMPAVPPLLLLPLLLGYLKGKDENTKFKPHMLCSAGAKHLHSANSQESQIIQSLGIFNTPKGFQNLQDLFPRHIILHEGLEVPALPHHELHGVLPVLQVVPGVPLQLVPQGTEQAVAAEKEMRSGCVRQQKE
ncbi:hypothetical protein Nmel_015943 [Mimus melanotis]